MAEQSGVQKVLVIGSVYPRFHEDAEVPWLRTSIAHLKMAGLDIQVLAPAYKGLKSHEIDGVKVNRFRYAPASWEFLTHEEGARRFLISLAGSSSALRFAASLSPILFMRIGRSRMPTLHSVPLSCSKFRWC